MKSRLGIILLMAVFAAAGCQRQGNGDAMKSASSQKEVLPQPEPPFAGTIGKTVAESKPDYPKPTKAPADAPNVLLILTDDTGYGHASTFGGMAATPALDKLAQNGVRYGMFHTTALCSPTRAALLTGRNHHSVGTGVIIEMGTGYPGYTGIVPNSTAGLPEILRQNGYATAAFGKWHNTPDNEISAAGPFDRWPTGKTWGFEYFYGFMNGETHQYYPVLYRNTTPVQPPKTPAQGYHLTEDLADEAIAYINRVDASNPAKPWFIYFSTGAIHAPHHTPKAYRDKYNGKFNMGWDKYREQVYEQQKKLGVIPASAQLTPRPEEIPAWDGLSDQEKKVYERLMENYSGFLEHTDVQIGRVIDAVEKSGELDNTLIIYIVGDNGASAEGGLEGTVNELASLNGIQLGIQGLLDKFDEIGGPDTDPHVPVGWAWAANAPFRWTKQVSSHFGGTRNPMVVSWPGHMNDPAAMRWQFGHVIDVAPTVLEAAGIQEPEEVNGVVQKPIEGTSFLYTLADADAPTRHTVQYFEMLGTRGIYKDGWMACTRHDRIPWETASQGTPFSEDRWELYNLNEDFTQANDIAAQNPQKVEEMKATFDAEARKYNVFPLDDRMAERFDTTLRPNPLAGKTTMVYGPGSDNISESGILNMKGVPFDVIADIESAGDGALMALGGVSGGMSLYVKNGRPTFYYNFFDVAGYRIQSPEVLLKGASKVRLEFRPDEPGPGKPATVTLFVNDKQVAQGKVEKTVPFRFGVEPFDVGADNVSAVSRDYSAPYSFKGQLKSVTINLPQPAGQ
jgi:arylsulfatase A-like enzyme